jgi:hypothetical protein
LVPLSATPPEGAIRLLTPTLSSTEEEWEKKKLTEMAPSRSDG